MATMISKPSLPDSPQDVSLTLMGDTALSALINKRTYTAVRILAFVGVETSIS